MPPTIVSDQIDAIASVLAKAMTGHCDRGCLANPEQALARRQTLGVPSKHESTV